MSRPHARHPLRRLRHSLKGRLVALFLLVALATTAVFVVGVQRLLQGGWQAYARPLVADYVDRLAAELGTPPDPAKAAALVARLPVSVRIDGPTVQFDSDPEGRRRRWNDDDESALARTTADGHHIRFGLARPATVLRSPAGIGWLTLAALLALTAAAYLVVRRMLRPLDEIGAAATRFGAGDFSRPIALQRDDELGELARHVDAMAVGLRERLEAKRALLLAISHELRSPLTRARVNAELVAEGPERDALLRDLGEMRDLITDLLESERLSAGHAALHAEPTDVAALARELLVTSFPGRVVNTDLDDALGRLSVDPTRWRLLLRNLVGNALRHAGGAPTPPQLFLRREADGRLACGVRDFGAGVPDAQLSRLSEAFYRPDDARQRATGGVGLGLTLCKLVAEAHGGTLRLRNVSPGLEAAVVWAPATR